MIIRKYLHSCILLEDHGKRLLIDPGAYSFIEGKIKPEDIGGVDAIVLTHKHGDHYDPDALRRILAFRPAKIISHNEIGELVKAEGFTHELIAAGETREVAGFKIQAFAAAHEPLPEGVPDHLAYLVNDTFLHPGDSLHVAGLSHVEVLGLPVAAPWGTIVGMLDFAKSLVPQHAVPIHDGFVKDFMLDRIYERCDRILGEAGIAFHPFKLGEILEI